MSKDHTQPMFSLPGKPPGSSVPSGSSSSNPPVGTGGPAPNQPPNVGGSPPAPNQPVGGGGQLSLPPGCLRRLEILAAVLLVVSVAMSIAGFEISQGWFIGSFLALGAFIVLAYWIKLGWSGLPAYLGPPGDFQREKTAWDWAQIVIIPLVILLVGSLIASSQQTISNNALTTQHVNDVQMAQDQLNENELSTYLVNMAGLLQQPNARTTNQAGADIRNIARADTLTVLEELVTDSKLNMNRGTATTQPNSERKKRVLRFLYESGLINRDPNLPPFVSLAGADFSYADLRDAQLNGANLAGAIFSHADMSGALLNSADLSQATLNYVNLSGAQLTYAQIVGGVTSGSEVDLSHANLSGADLSGADLLGTRLTNTNFKNADITGTTFPPNSDKQKNGAMPQARWKLTQVDSIVTIAYNDMAANRLTGYSTLDLNTSRLQLIYGPLSNKGTAIVLLPALWSQENCPGAGNYCETAPVTITCTQLVVHATGPGPGNDICANGIPIANTMTVTDVSMPGSNIILCLKGTISGLQVDLTVEFFQPAQDSMTVIVNAKATNATGIRLGPIMDAPFRPVVMRSVYFPITTKFGNQFDTQKALINKIPIKYLSPLPPQNARIVPGVNAQSFGLMGNNAPFDPVRNTATIEVTMMQPTVLPVTVEEQPSNDPNGENLGLWAGSNTLLDAWSYTVVASNPYLPAP